MSAAELFCRMTQVRCALAARTVVSVEVTDTVPIPAVAAMAVTVAITRIATMISIRCFMGVYSVGIESDSVAISLKLWGGSAKLVDPPIAARVTPSAH